MSKTSNRVARQSDAVFLGWQEIPWGTPLALYNITAPGHPSNGSTVCEDTLREFHLKIPKTPSRKRGPKSATGH